MSEGSDVSTSTHQGGFHGGASAGHMTANKSLQVTQIGENAHNAPEITVLEGFLWVEGTGGCRLWRKWHQSAGVGFVLVMELITMVTKPVAISNHHGSRNTLQRFQFPCSQARCNIEM
jgi:hypothetical protein